MRLFSFPYFFTAHETCNFVYIDLNQFEFLMADRYFLIAI